MFHPAPRLGPRPFRLVWTNLGLAMALLALKPVQPLTLALEPTEKPSSQRHVWSFESDTPGQLAKGFSSEVGTWEVANDGGNHVLYQKAKSDDAIYNIVLSQGTNSKDLDLSVRLKPVAGEVDQGGGVVWRAIDRQNYYVCRFNPLEDNFRLYKVEAGNRKQLASAKVAGDMQWHTLRVTMHGSQIQCQLDGKPLLQASDSTFPNAGMVGLWTKSDAQTYFDDLTVNE